MLDLKNRKFLNTASSEWDWNVDDARSFSKQLIDTMIANQGIGLAANQVGVDRRVFAIGSEHMGYFKEPKAVFNPKILYVSEQQSLYKEGCLSFPDLWIDVKRPETLSVEYFDYNGDRQQADLAGLDARCFQHEYDHLDGVCFIDRVSKLKLQLAMKRMRKSKK